MIVLQPSNQVRTEARKSKIGALPPEQRRALVKWLVEDKVTYAEASARLRQQFQASISIDSIFHFWHRHCAPPLVHSDILLDVVIESTAPVRLIIKQKGDGLSVTTK